MSRMPLDPGHTQLNPLLQGIQLPPQILVHDRFPASRNSSRPVIGLPSGHPLREPLEDVLAVPDQLDHRRSTFRALQGGFEASNDGHELHSVVRGLGFPSESLRGGAPMLQNEGPASRTWIGRAAPIRMQREFQAFQPSLETFDFLTPGGRSPNLPGSGPRGPTTPDPPASPHHLTGSHRCPSPHFASRPAVPVVAGPTTRSRRPTPRCARTAEAPSDRTRPADRVATCVPACRSSRPAPRPDRHPHASVPLVPNPSGSVTSRDPRW